MKIELDQNNKKILYKKTLNEDNYQAMMEWEKPYMKALIKNLKPSGHVLEIGFGLGYSASEIQKYDIKSHTIIEDDKDTLIRLKKWASKQKSKVNIIEGTWQTKLCNLKKFDTIFFDDCPNPKHPDRTNTRLFNFYYDILENHVNKNCKFSFYMDNEFIYWPVNVYTNWSIKEMKIKIPSDAKYIRQHNDKMYLPLIIFNKGTKTMPRVIINRFDI